MDKVQRKNITSLRHSLSQHRNVAELRTWQWYYIATKVPTAQSLSPYTKFIYSEWDKKRWDRGDATSGWNHVFSLRRHRRFRATCCQHLQETQCLGILRTIRASTVRKSFVFVVAHSPHHTIIMHLYHHSWSPVYISIMTQEDTAGLQFHAVHPPHPKPSWEILRTQAQGKQTPSAPPTNRRLLPHRQHARKHVTRLAHRITNLFVIIRLTDTSFFLGLSCSV